MPRDPVADDRSELTYLEREPIVPRRNAKCVLRESNLRAATGGIKAAIEPRLRKKIDVRPDLRVQKEDQPRIKQIVDLAIDQPRRRLIEMVKFQVDRPTQARAQIVMEGGDG